MQQPPQKPSAWKRFTLWYGRLSGRGKLIFWAVIVVVIVIGVIVNATSQPAQTAQISSTPTPVPTATPKPTPSPSPTPATTQAKIVDLINANATNTSKVDIEQNDGKTVVVQLTMNSASGDNATYRGWIQQNCFAVEKALYTANISSLGDVDIAFRGVDFPGPIGVCDLTQKTASGFTWSSLKPETAWTKYDQASFYTNISS